jgi:hypothetical protein
MATSPATGRSWNWLANSFHIPNPGLSGFPTGRAVFISRRRSKRSGISMGRVRPRIPPQSWQTSVMPERPSRSMKRSRVFR